MYVSHMDKIRSKYKILFGKPERKRPLGRPGHRWENSIKVVGLEGIVYLDVDWIHLAEGRVHWWSVLNVVVYLWVV